MAKATINPDLTIHDRVTSTSAAWVQLSSHPAGERIIHISATGDIAIGIGASEPTTAYYFAESNGALPMVIRADPTEVWVRSWSGTNYITTATYKPNFGPLSKG